MTNSNSVEFVQVGRVKDAHGIKGELFVVLFAGEAAWLERLTQLRLVKPETRAELQQNSSAGSYADSTKLFTIKSARLHKNGLIIKTGELKDRNEAEALCGYLFEIPSDFLVSNEGDSLYLKEIEGFQVFTQAKGSVGHVAGFGFNGAQDLLVVKTGWGDFEVPFVEAFVSRIDFAAREIHLELPEGLLGEPDQDDGQEDIDQDQTP